MKKKRSRCLSCGRFIRNHSYCFECVELHRTWVEGMRQMHYPNDDESGRVKLLKEMEQECEQ